jgi:hypothetical protein
MLNRFVSDASLSFLPYLSPFFSLPTQCPAKLQQPLVKLVKSHLLVVPLESKSSPRKLPRRPQLSPERKRLTKRVPIRKKSPNLLGGQSERPLKSLTAHQRTRKLLQPRRFGSHRLPIAARF